MTTNPLAYNVGVAARRLWLQCCDCGQTFTAQDIRIVGDVLAAAVAHNEARHKEQPPEHLEPLALVNVVNYHRDDSMSTRAWHVPIPAAELVAAMMGKPDGTQIIPPDVADEAQRLSARTVLNYDDDDGGEP